MDLLVLVGGNCGKNSLWKAESLHTLPSRNRFGWRKLAAEVLPDHMDTRLIFVHGVQDDLGINRVIFITYSSAFTRLLLYALQACGIMKLWISARSRACSHTGHIWEHVVSQCVHMLMRYESGRGEYLTSVCWRQSVEAAVFPPAIGLFLITPSVSVRLQGLPQPRRSGRRRGAFAKQLDDSKFNIPAPPISTQPKCTTQETPVMPKARQHQLNTEEVFKATLL